MKHLSKFFSLALLIVAFLAFQACEKEISQTETAEITKTENKTALKEGLSDRIGSYIITKELIVIGDDLQLPIGTKVTRMGLNKISLVFPNNYILAYKESANDLYKATASGGAIYFDCWCANADGGTCKLLYHTGDPKPFACRNEKCPGGCNYQFTYETGKVKSEINPIGFLIDNDLPSLATKKVFNNLPLAWNEDVLNVPFLKQAMNNLLADFYGKAFTIESMNAKLYQDAEKVFLLDFFGMQLLLPQLNKMSDKFTKSESFQKAINNADDPKEILCPCLDSFGSTNGGACEVIDNKKWGVECNAKKCGSGCRRQL